MRILKIGGGVLLLLTVAFWAAAHLFLGGLIRNQASAFGERVGYRIEVGEVDLSPLLLRVRLNDLRLAPEHGDALFALKQLELNARFLPLLMGRVSIERIGLEEPVLLLERAPAAGRSKAPAAWNWQVFVDRVQKLSADNETKKDDHSSIKIRIDEIALNAGKVAVRDGVNKSFLDLGPFSIRLSDLSNTDETGHTGGSSLTSKYVLNLGSVKVPLPHVDGVPDRQLAFGKVVATGQLMGNAHAEQKVALDLRLDEGEIKSTWNISDRGALTGSINVEKLAVKPWLSLAPTNQPLDSASGVIDGRFELRQDAEALTLDGDVKFDQMDIRLVGTKEPLLAWATTSLSQLHLVLPRAEGKPGQLSMNEILVDNPKIRFVINAQRQSNFRSLFSTPESTGAASPSPATSASPPPPSPAFRYDIRSVRLKSGGMFFGDESIKPEFHVDVTDLNGSVQGISNEPNRYASLVLNGRAARTGSLRARGQLAFADPRLNNDVSLVFKNIPLNTTNPYTMTFAGYRIDDGRIDVDLRYVTKDGQLQGKNRFVIKKIKLGDEVADYQGTRLPLGLAIALLEDSDGMIDVNIPVKGNVNDPEFSVGHLVWQAVKTVLTNVATAPFRALGALLGVENMDAVAFVPGESALPPEGDEQLAKIAELLAKRPQSKLVIHGSYDPSVDSAELARAMADRAILVASGITLSPGEPLPTPNLSDPKVKAGLKSAYGSQVGRIKLGQRLLTLPDNADRDSQLRQEMIQGIKISDDQLKQLATERANAVKTKLLAVDPKLSDRVSIGDAVSVSASDAGVPLSVELDTGK